MSRGPEPPPTTANERSAVTDALDRYELAWRRGERPSIDELLPDDSAHRRPVLVELVLIELELRLKAGEPARAEEYFARYPALADDPVTAADVIAAEYEFRRRREPGLALDEYHDRFPQHRAGLAERVARAMARTEAPGPATPRRPDPDAAPRVVGYAVGDRLGKGGMGVVYRARQLSLDRPVALKLLRAACARDPEWLARFRREALTASALNHPNICTVYDAGDADGRPYLCLELIDGETFDAVVRRRAAVEEAARLVGQAAQALAAAHAAGVVHRDVKPTNLMVRPDGIVKVLDFGLARGPTDAGAGTDPGTRLGTLMYMAPEQARAETVGPPADVFALGVVLYELLTGEHPFRADGEFSVLLALEAHTPVPPSRLNPLVPAYLEAITLRMLAKAPDDRPTADEVGAALADPAAVRGAPAPSPRGRVTVGRGAEMAALVAGFESAASGRGSVLCVTGEPGLGKTTLVGEFLDGLAAARSWVARGHCSERLAGTEAYLPVLEALDGLLRGPDGATAGRVMRTLAPSWYAQVAPASGDDAGRPPQERLKREFCQLLGGLARTRPVVLFLDDVHWADPSSVDLLAYLGDRCARMGVLVVLTYRPAELLLGRHPFARVRLDLQGRGVCREVALADLTRDDLTHYLASAFPGHRFPACLVDAVHARTGGNPLFLVDLLGYLRDRGVLADAGDGWTADDTAALQLDLPESVRSLIQRKLDQLNADDRQLLAAASVQGAEFDSAVVAAVLGRPPADVEERLLELDRVHALVRFVREHEFPDRTLSVRYAFAHVLYQDALSAALPPTRKVGWSAAAARALAAHHGERVGAAVEIALLFEAAREPDRAVGYFRLAAEEAVRAAAHREAADLARRGLTVLRPDADSRQELALLVALGVSLVATEGFASAEVERTYDRARRVAERTGDPAALFPVLYGLWNVALLRSELNRCTELASQLHQLAQQQPDPVHLLQAHNVVQQPLLHLGEFAAARDHQERSLALYDGHAPRELTAVYGEDPGIGCLAYRAVALWCLGFPDQAVRSARAARALAEAGGNPFDLARSLYFGAFTHLCRREPGAVRGMSLALADVSREHGFTLLVAGATVLHGWSLTADGRTEDGLARMRQGLSAWQATGAVSHRPYHLGLYAEALGRAGRPDEAIAAIDEGLALAAATRECFLEAELHRIRGELLADDEATACFRRAIETARHQQAKSLGLRAAISLARRCGDRGPLTQTAAWFTEGFDTPDWRDAKAVLDGSAPFPQPA